MEPIETEVKLRCESVEEFKSKLELAGVKLKLKRDKHFEDNFVLDSEEGVLRNRFALLRVRHTDDLATITLKEVPPPDTSSSKFKSRLELETQVDDSETMLKIFARLGFRKVFRYQKFRTVFEAALPSGETLDVMFDETPIGVFVELEGKESEVAETLTMIGVERDEHILHSYIAIQIDRCASEGKPLSDLVFQVA